MFKTSLILASCLVGVSTNSSHAEIIVHLEEFIAESERTNFVGFDGLPPTQTYTSTHSEGGMNVTQVNGDENEISTFFNAGERGWSPDFGDNGYTEITLTNSDAEFESIEFQRRSGGNFPKLYYELLSNGAIVLQGSVDHGDYETEPGSRIFGSATLGFSGGGFDTVRLRDGSAGIMFHNGSLNTLAIDSIEAVSTGATAVPEPSSLALCGVGACAMAVIARRRRRRELKATTQ